MRPGPSMLLRSDLVEIVARTQDVLKTSADQPAARERALTAIAAVFRQKGLLDGALPEPSPSR